MNKFLLIGLLSSLIIACDHTPKKTLPIISYAPLPAFEEFTDVNQKKQQFTHYILPLIKASNQQILKQRNQLVSFNSKIANSKLSKKQHKILIELAEDYRVDTTLGDKQIITELLTKIDVVPPALVLAQAANESAWGTSRFAKEGNNLFGQWCYQKGCGLVPLSRVDGANHEVRKFDSVYQSVNAYMNNLNSHPAYQALREHRQIARTRGEIDAIELASFLTSYSERGEAYVHELQQMMRSNRSLWPSQLSVSS
ncbi:glucosaminidase domain-containing protein [Agarivorans sp. 1_MG-2023]|uniref:glucosaminidase domain-containing protein n=1 Tax=Agarivorans sp. 1_MG-2023 TaxID=3062634 RepID=UPI0026E25056|nr:glucosaminidase domain-containing protein [Agarivorans sp. 1_MG-2023]MDO6762283.1 glucosaminidase domain-containing protein [Agarivorans sp. 1_MG-2023]